MILDTIAASTRLRIEKDKEVISPERMKELATLNTQNEPFSFEKRLKQPGMHFICEVKKASPSKGVIAEYFPYLEIAKEYEEAGADCISVLTEPEFFMGSDVYLQEIKQAVHIPVLRKDFTLDEYQIYQAKALGADCVLLICALLSEEEIKTFISLCDQLSLSAIVETHDEDEVAMAVRAGARILGVNNRNLKTFDVNINNSLRLRSMVPEEILFVAESGIHSYLQVKELEDAKVNAVLVGESLMKSKKKKMMLDKLRGNADES
jgi:indole-3-glycerol phosphate synthase